MKHFSRLVELVPKPVFLRDMAAMLSPISIIIICYMFADIRFLFCFLCSFFLAYVFEASVFVCRTSMPSFMLYFYFSYFSGYWCLCYFGDWWIGILCCLYNTHHSIYFCISFLYTVLRFYCKCHIREEACMGGDKNDVVFFLFILFFKIVWGISCGKCAVTVLVYEICTGTRFTKNTVFMQTLSKASSGHRN